MTTRPLIAVVDDDRVFTEMVRDLLDGEGYATLLIHQAAGAVEVIAAAGAALVLLDIRMETPDAGAEVLIELRANPATDALPVIVCTADQQFLKERAAFLTAYNATPLAKPFDLDTLLALIREALGVRP